MKIIPNIDLSKKEVKSILSSSYEHGGESIICRTDNPCTLYKIFRKGKSVATMPENKFQKIKCLYEMSLKHSVQPIRTLSQHGELIGYEMTFDPADVKVCPSNLPYAQRIRFLKETKQILEYFATQDIVFGDIAYRNILYNNQTGEFKFCDMDNIQLREYPIDLIARTTSLGVYYNSCGINDKTDAFMHNHMTLSTLGIEYPFYDDQEVEDVFVPPASAIIDSMETPELFKGEYIVKYLKR